MTRILPYIIICFFLVTCGTAEKRVTLKLFPDGKIEKEKVFPNRKDTLTYTEITYYQSGGQKSVIEFYDSRFNGKILEFYENGKKKLEAMTQMSDFIGVKYNYDSVGRLMQMDSLYGKCPATDCCCDGVVTRFYINGKIKEKFTNKSGLINGEVLTYFENGSLESIRYFIDEKEEGTSKYWSEDGKLSQEVSYHLGLKNGRKKEYYDYYTSEGQFVNGKEEGVWMYIDTAGKVIRTENYKNGKVVK